MMKIVQNITLNHHFSPLDKIIYDNVVKFKTSPYTSLTRPYTVIDWFSSGSYSILQLLHCMCIQLESLEHCCRLVKPECVIAWLFSKFWYFWIKHRSTTKLRGHFQRLSPLGLLCKCPTVYLPNPLIPWQLALSSTPLCSGSSHGVHGGCRHWSNCFLQLPRPKQAFSI